MIISFSVENWMSFQERTTFSMAASRERQHNERIPRLDKFQTRLLPIAAIYGGNASGKTNFFKALNFMKWMVINGPHLDGMIPIEPFLLDEDHVNQPSRFSIEILADENIYEFSFSATREAIVEEKLVKISSSSEVTLYHRIDGKPNFDDSLISDQPLNFAFKGTRDNQLFITNSVSQKITTFISIYNWFKNNLTLIAPDSRFASFENFLEEKHPLSSIMTDVLSQLDTGITHLGGEAIPLDNLPISVNLKNKIMEDTKEGKTTHLMDYSKNKRFVFTYHDNKLTAKKLVSFHSRPDGSEVQFEINQESDGTQRLIDLLPAFLELSAQSSNKVFIIDEVDRSLHTLLIRNLLEAYLANCSSKTRAQVLITTHDVSLMDQHLFRRDEMWIAERDNSGVSTLFSFSEYKDVRYDKDVRKSYLQGRLGGIPRIPRQGVLFPPNAKEDLGDDS